MAAYLMDNAKNIVVILTHPLGDSFAASLKDAVLAVCVAAGLGAAGLFEIC